MSYFSTFGVVVFPTCLALAGVRQGAVLDYTIKVRRQNETAWVESSFQMIAAPALVTGNKVKKPRMGTWRLQASREPLTGSAVAPSAALLAQARGLMYFSGPMAGLLLRPGGMTLGGRFCRLWQAETAPGLAAYVYLAEVAPNLLALSYLSASLGDGDVAALEIHLVKVDLGAHPSPAEDGAALLRTLRRWSVRPFMDPSQNTEAMASERID